MIEPERRDLAWTPRWAIVRVNRRQSVAEHMYFTACYAHWITQFIAVNSNEYRTMMEYILKHDESECFMSDIPGPIKRMTGHAGDLDAVEKRLHDKIFEPTPNVSSKVERIKKFADVMDECMYLAGEAKSGNNAVSRVLQGCKQRLHKALLDIEAVHGVQEIDGRDWKEYLQSVIENEEKGCGRVVSLLVGQ